MYLITRRIVSILLLTLFAFSVHGQLVAGFTAAPSAGCAPLLVTFTNTTTPVAGTTYSWDLGNGSGVITLTSPSTSYLTAGTYTVTLTATHGTTSNTHKQVITVYPTPVVGFTTSDTAVCPGVPITFTSTTAGGVPGPITYLWSFGDGFTSADSSIAHYYSIPGHFSITLNATNADGCTSSLTKVSYVHVFTPPVPNFSASNTHFCAPPGNAVFTSAPTGTPPFTYQWTFGDGSLYSTLANPNHSYTTPDSFTVALRVTDGHGCADSSFKHNYISVANLVSSFTHPDTACYNTQVSFINTSSAHTNSLWTFGDGNSSIVNSSHNTYHAPGTYNVSLVVFDGYCYDTATHPIVIPAPITSFTLTPAHLCPAPVVATFATSAPASSTVLWHFGDSLSGSGNPVTHLYAKNKVDTIQMIAISDIGCRDTVRLIDTIFDMNFGVDNGTLDLEGCAPLTINFSTFALTSFPHPNPNYNYPYTPFIYTWNLGDGGPPSNSATPSHTYTAVGVYPISVSILTANGCSFTTHDSVRVGTPPTATFTATPRHVCYKDNEISFTRTVTSGPVNAATWLFGEGVYGFALYDTSTADTEVVAHHFDLPGLFSDTLISYYNGCPDTFIRKDYVLIDSPMAKLKLTVNCVPVNTVDFTNLSLGDDVHIWSFGDGTTSTLLSPIHTYPAPLMYTGKLTTYNTASGCSDTAALYVNLSRPTVTISTPDTAVCKDTFLHFTSSITGTFIDYYKWIANGSWADNTLTDFVDTFHTPGRYTIQLVILDGNLCPDTTTRTNYILVARPVAHFTVTPASVCWAQGATFLNTSTDTDPPLTFFSSIKWEFGDGGTAVTDSPSIVHTFTAPGIDTTKMIVTDNVGCKDSVTLALATVYRPKASFTAGTSTPCLFIPVTFTNTSTPAASYNWSFGDGFTSTVSSPAHTYVDSGTYTVRLIITDAHGCRDTATQVNSIRATRPHAAFSMDDSISICTPFNVHFTNHSTGNLVNNWNLGNGNSVALSPTQPYEPGYDTITLVVTNSFGCKDTAAAGHVKVYGYPGAFSYFPDSGCAPLTVSFNAEAASVPGITGIVWDFGNGITSAASLADTITYTYLTPRLNVPKLIINATGCVGVSSLGIDTIKVDSIRAGFTANPNPVCIRDSMMLIDTSHSFTSHITALNWSFNGMTSTVDSPWATFTTAGTYTITMQVTDAWTCTATATKMVTVYALPDIAAGPDSVICTGATINLHDSDAGGVWNSGNPVVATVGAVTGIVKGIAGGTAVITYTKGAGCFTTTSVTVNTFPDPGVVTGDTGLCAGATITLSDSVTGGAWTSSNGDATIAGGTGDSINIRGIVAGKDTIRYQITNITCVDTATKIITIFPLPDAGTITGRNVLCADSTVTLGESTGGGKWNSSNTAIATIDSVTGVINELAVGAIIITYTVGPDANGCINDTTLAISVSSLLLTGTVTQITCYGSNDGSISTAVSGGTGPYQYVWSDTASSPAIENLGPGAYTVKVTDTKTQCVATDSFTVTQPDSLLIIDSVKDDFCNLVNGGISVEIKGGIPPYQYQWSNNMTGNDITGLAAGTYTMTVTDANGCQKSLGIAVKDSACPPIIIHDGVSPNGDGINDTWVIERIQDYPANEVQVFDKWGDRVYEKTNYKNDWGGTWKNGLVPDGTYYYLIKLNADDYPGGKDAFTGYLMIKR